MENTGFKVSSVFFILYIYRMKKIMKEKNQVVPNEVLRKEFLSQFKTEADVSKFLKQLHAKYWKRCLKAQWMPIWVMKRILRQETTLATPGMAVIRRKSKPNVENLSFPFRVTVTASLNR